MMTARSHIFQQEHIGCVYYTIIHALFYCFSIRVNFYLLQKTSAKELKCTLNGM